MIGIALNGTGVLVAVLWYTGEYAHAGYHSRVTMSRFEVGCAAPSPPLIEDMARADLKAELMSEMTRMDGLYSLIYGLIGTGKTHLVQSAAHSLGGGTLFVHSETANDFVPTFARAIGLPETGTQRALFYSSPLTRSHVTCVRSEALFDLTSHVTTMAIEWMATRNRPLTLVIDNCDALAKSTPDVLSQLQRWAKRRADDRSVRVVFVAGEPPTRVMLIGANATHPLTDTHCTATNE